MPCDAASRKKAALQQADIEKQPLSKGRSFFFPEYAFLVHNSGFAAGKDRRTEHHENAVLQIRPTQILPGGDIDLTDAYGIRFGDVKDGDFLKAGEVLFNNTNSSAWVGKSAVFHGSNPSVCSNHITRLRL